MRVLLFCALLLLPSVAGATPFSASIMLDLTTLQFSGIPISLSLIIPRGNGFDSLIEVEQRNIDLVDHSSRPVVLSQNIFSLSRIEGATSESTHSGSNVLAFANPTMILSAVSLNDSGFASSLIAHNTLVTADEAGILTASIDYTLFHSPALANDPDFFSGGRAGLSIGRFDDPNQARQFADFHVNINGFPDSALIERGTLSASYLFQEGQSTVFEVFAQTRASVPEPESILLLMIGLVIVGWVQYTRRNSKCPN